MVFNWSLKDGCAASSCGGCLVRWLGYGSNIKPIKDELTTPLLTQNGSYELMHGVTIGVYFSHLLWSYFSYNFDKTGITLNVCNNKIKC